MAAMEVINPILQHQPKVILKMPQIIDATAKPCLGVAYAGGGGGCHPCIGWGGEYGPGIDPPDGAFQFAGLFGSVTRAGGFGYDTGGGAGPIIVGGGSLFETESSTKVVPS